MEDIDVEHRQVKTAMFDVKSRCLVLPQWKEMPNHLYDLLVGHEVGHALSTPADEKTLKNIKFCALLTFEIIKVIPCQKVDNFTDQFLWYVV